MGRWIHSGDRCGAPMMRLSGLIPSSLRGQMLVLLFGALIAVQLITLAFFFSERRLAVRAALGAEAAERTANVVGLVEAAPAGLRQEILRSAGSPLMRFELSDVPRAKNDGPAAAGVSAGRRRAGDARHRGRALPGRCHGEITLAVGDPADRSRRQCPLRRWAAGRTTRCP